MREGEFAAAFDPSAVSVSLVEHCPLAEKGAGLQPDRSLQGCIHGSREVRDQRT